MKWSIALILAICGCSPTVRESQLTAIVGDWRGEGVGFDQFSEQYDFGAVFARDQTLSQEFVLTNRSNCTFKITNATALTPCCSSVGPVPREPIPPGGFCRIPTLLKAIASSVERKSVSFVVETDIAEVPKFNYRLGATLRPDLEVRPEKEAPADLIVGKSGIGHFRVVSHRIGSDADSQPITINAEEPLEAEFVGDPIEEADMSGTTSNTRLLRVSIPPTTKCGLRRASVVLRRSDGRVEPLTVA